MRRMLVVLVALVMVLAVAGPVTADPPPSTIITVVGPHSTDSAEGEALDAELNAFDPGGPIEVVYEDYAGTLLDRVTGADPPDVVIFPHPFEGVGLAPYLTDLGSYLNERLLRRDYGDHLIDLVTVDGAVLGAPIRVSLKSLVWYQPAEFAYWGYSIPQTFTELIALSDQIGADGGTPWCMFMESGFATGWMGTDWIEDLLLSTEGPVVYDQWVDHTVVFQDPRIEEAFERYLFLVDTPGYVFQRPLITTEPFWFNAVPLGEGDCLMHKQADFFVWAIGDFGYDLADFSTFEFPPVNAEFGDSAVGGAEWVAAVNDTVEVRRLIRYMVGPRFGKTTLAASGFWLLPNVRSDTRLYPDDLRRSWAETIQTAIAADQFRYDGSDLMPPIIATQEFWSGLRDLLDGVRTIPEVLMDIDNAWPE